MTELLALPGWKSEPTTLDEWAARLGEAANLGAPAAVRPDPPGAAWIEVDALNLRGYALLAGEKIEAINFELDGPDPAPAARAVEAAALALGWEVDADYEPDPDDDDGDD